jgi:tight adherence protein B
MENMLTDYNEYKMTRKEKVLYIIMAAATIYLIGYVFFKSHIFSGILCPLALFYPHLKTKDIVERRKVELNNQFKDMLYSLSSSLSAGKSIEGAFKETLKDLVIIYPDPHTAIIKEVENIVKRLEMNDTIEAAVSDFARRAHIEDIETFADVFHICKRTGGNLVEVIKNTSNIINDKIEVRQEINTLLSERKFEQKLLNVLPIVMIILISISADDYIRPVFTTVYGRGVMCAAIVLLVTAYFISKKIMDIKV